ncbi:uncharacterized protein LOC116016710 isoform X1 [Ipomoea triloba]|uniref:uncharacterized protein LOC116016710 isoform X1 n=2 Tax=Ipomoea triloba TaxID=35885 RepID=UPI00125E5BCF|nr:uncharacterized protein LOC116016710 isoform X1 [Ipomoea triloba]
MIEHKEEDWCLRRGQYLGEISALCFLHLPPHLSSLPYLLAGTGSQILVYDLASGLIIRSFEVFDGVRVHGISLGPFSDHSSDSTTVTFKIAVFGERRVKLFSLLINSLAHPRESLHLSLTLMQSLPRLGHWVLDVAFFHGNQWLAIGCSDNSVYFWDMLRCKVLSQVSCSERCLLYSMRIWGNEVDSLRVASGTIFNEVIVWKLDSTNDVPAFGSPAVDNVNLTNEKGNHLPIQPYTAINLFRLIGHEGSIFRLAWSPDGSKIVSVSDDRSARVWILDESKCLQFSVEGPNQSVSSVLFGHTARVWDCCIFDHLIVTAGEDCTCRIWGLDGAQLNLIKEHIGRGVWRCAYHPDFSLLVTAGFDSAIKVHQLQTSPEFLGKIFGAQELSTYEKEAFKLSIPNSTEHVGHMDSKSEYVRCLHFSCEDSLYIATNNGYVYHAKLCHTGNASWTKLLHIGEDAPIVCMDMLSNRSDPSCGIDDWVAVGDGKGRMMIAHLAGDVCSPKVECSFTWSAEIERQLLGTYWSNSLGYRFIFTVDPRGRLKLWRLWNPQSSVSHVEADYRPELVSEFVSCVGMRIICLDASLEDEVLVCGDIRGNVLLFPLKKNLLYNSPITLEEDVSPLAFFKGAHGISTVCSVSIVGSSPSQLDIHSTGGDGCICYFEYDRNQKNLEFTGIKQVKELSTVQSVYSNADYNNKLPSGSYAIGFASSEFIIWNLSSERKVVQILCGGWRRPHSYYLGHSPEMKNCFAFVKDGIIYIHRYWVEENDREMYPKNLHLQFHGREIHSLSFIHPDPSYSPNGKQSYISESSWIATGCEDGTVRLTRYEAETESWLTSMLLGEHVGGSAVRSICSLSKIHRIMLKATDKSERVQQQMGNLEDQENLLLLISVGAKRVITAWKQKIRSIDQRIESQYCKHDNRDGSTSHGSSSKKFSPPLFQWLSSDMPTRNNNGIRENIPKIIGAVKNDQPFPSKDSQIESKSYLLDRSENDWRYLAVTAFLAKGSDSRTTVCFIVVASSDATLSLRALILPHRLWFDVALLTPLSSPVLALQHIIVPRHLLSEENIQIGDLYMVISGSTDGSIALWDLTDHVENFMQLLSTLEMEKGIDNQKRPRTGRGSQGGRWWRSLGSHASKKRPGGEQLSDPSLREKGENSSSLTTKKANDASLQNYDADCLAGCFHTKQSRHVSSEGNHNASLHRKEKTDVSSLDICEIGPLHVFNDMHQSGVNCLHVSHVNKPTASDSTFKFCVLSGGDDQSLNCLTFVFTTTQNLELLNLEADISPSRNMENSIYYCQIHNHQMRLLSVDKISSAHSSAVKGVWTDGRWVFSTGLDQRVRCWNIEQGKLIERAHLVISVPEPEALDARPCDRDRYQIAVAGRGMQMVEFYAPGKMNCGK